eukprot:TRINITY_DN47674_c0_g1_i1.p1 TRINITY_DN47674_c0_g1~~TRINITY_DN47674_c0_g1_i1.p1  ORF type:complete len:287 (-),score=79.88 TRINITY_DN47674_c0_g1_i1:198-1001(-)
MELLSQLRSQYQALPSLKEVLAGIECGGEFGSRCRVARTEVPQPPQWPLGPAAAGISTGENAGGLYYNPEPSSPAHLAGEERDGLAASAAGEFAADGGGAGAEAEEDGANVASARSVESAESDMAAEEREREKARLQRLLKDFAKEAVAGIAVGLVNPNTGRKPSFLLQMDRHLTLITLRAKDGSAAEHCVQDVRVADVTSIYKGHEVFLRAPALGRDAVGCVGLDAGEGDSGTSVILHFDDVYDRDKFYTSMQVLSLSAGIQQQPR